jgi:hypothetical protein
MKKYPFKVGDLVTSDYHGNEISVVRKIIFIAADSSCGSGFRVSADAGIPCKTCGKTFGRVISGVDSPWFKKVKIRKGKK